MTGIVCLDQEDGLLFNGRRQSRDRVVTEKILSITEGKPLWMSAYSRRIFPEDAPVRSGTLSEKRQGEILTGNR